MLGAVLIILVILWFLGYIRIPGLVIKDITLFVFNGKAITLWEVLIFFVLLWALGILPSPFRQIAIVLFALWVLSTLGLIVIAGFSNLLVIAVIVGLVLSVLNNN